MKKKKTTGLFSLAGPALWMLTAALVLSGCASAAGQAPEEADSEDTALSETSAAESPVPEEKEPGSLSEETETEPAAKEASVPEDEAVPEAAAGETEENKEEALPGSSYDPEIEAMVEAKLAELTLGQKIAQMFTVLPEALTGTDTVTSVGELTGNTFAGMPVGGICYMQANLTSAVQTRELLGNFEAFSEKEIGLPIFSFVDEEGGDITRISGNPGFPEIPFIPSMQSIGETGNADNAFQTGAAIGSYLSDLGFTCDFAPVADVLSNPYNEIVRTRSFGDNPGIAAEMSEALAKGLESQGVLAVYKHFPGHGATAGDTHAGYAYTDKTIEQLRQCELIPFRNAIENGAEFIMISHISLPNVTGDDTPASLSPFIMKDLLRDEMGYEGIIITDAMNMGAIVDTYGYAPAAVKAIEAGADIVLITAELEETRSLVEAAVEEGTIPQEQIDASVRRILRVKYEIMRKGNGS